MGNGNTARNRILSFVDESSFRELFSLVTRRNTDFYSSLPETENDGVITGFATVKNRPVYVYSQDVSSLGGTLGEMHAKKIVRLYEMAMKTGTPVIGILDSNGVRLEELSDSLEGLGLLYKAKAEASGNILQIDLVFGKCGGGAAVLAAMSDIVLAEKNAEFFLNSPDTIDGNFKEKCNTASAEYQFKNSGIIDYVGDEAEVFKMARSLFEMLPENFEAFGEKDCIDDLNRLTDNLEGVEDAALAATEIADDRIYLEMKKEYAPCMTTGFISLDGMTVGVVGNRKDKLSSKGLKKATGFVAFCDAFSIPVLTLVNVQGFETSEKSEQETAKAAAEFALTLANADVPKVSVILKKANGSTYSLMNSKAIGADFAFAISGAKISVMDSDMASKIIGTKDAKEKLDELQNAETFAKRGAVDALINPADLRKETIAAFEMLSEKKPDFITKKRIGK